MKKKINPLNRSHLLNLRNIKYRREVETMFDNLFLNDTRNGDLTTNSFFFKKNKKIKAEIVAQEFGILAGGEEVIWWLKKNFSLKITAHIIDGGKIKKGTRLITWQGYPQDILRAERTILNILSRLSGVATLTANYAQKACPTKVAGTRKTILNVLEKKAIWLGGGLTHRIDLSDAVLVKENHLSLLAGRFDIALKKLWSKVPPGSFLEIEVKNQKEAIQACAAFQSIKLANKRALVFVVMFDNFSTAEIKKTLQELKKIKIDQDIFFEAAGNLNLKNINRYARLGLGALSVGALTHSAAAIDLSMRIKSD